MSKLQLSIILSRSFIIQRSFKGCMDLEVYFLIFGLKNTAVSLKVRSMYFQTALGEFFMQMIFAIIIYFFFQWYLGTKRFSSWFYLSVCFKVIKSISL